MEERTHEQNVTMVQSNWNPNMQTQNSYRNQGSQSREAPVQNVSWSRGTQEMPWDEREKEQRDAVEEKKSLFPDISINLLKLISSQGIVGEKSFVASR
jgi:hypothetical protein